MRMTVTLYSVDFPQFCKQYKDVREARKDVGKIFRGYKFYQLNLCFSDRIDMSDEATLEVFYRHEYVCPHPIYTDLKGYEKKKFKGFTIINITEKKDGCGHYIAVNDDGILSHQNVVAFDDEKELKGLIEAYNSGFRYVYITPFFTPETKIIDRRENRMWY